MKNLFVKYKDGSEDNLSVWNAFEGENSLVFQFKEDGLWNHISFLSIKYYRIDKGAVNNG